MQKQALSYQMKPTYYHINSSASSTLTPIDVGYYINDLQIKDNYPYYSLHFVVNNCIYLKIKNKVYCAKKNQLLLIPPNENFVCYTTPESGPAEYFWINFNGVKSENAVALTAFENSPIITVKRKKQLFDLFAQCLQQCQYPAVQSIAPQYMLYHLLHILITDAKKYVQPLPARPGANFQEILAFINSHLFIPNFNAKFVSENCFITPEHLCRIFKKNMNMHFTAYVNISRINRATTLIRETSLPLKQIALQAGFADYFHFCRVFKKYRLYTPSEYRNLPYK